MARRGSRKNSTPIRRVRRVVKNRNANLRLPDPLAIPRLSALRSFASVNPVLRDVEDRRVFHPSGPYRPARSVSRSHHVLVAPVGAKFSDAIGVGFDNPRKVLICIRRKQRREVLLALGRGGGGNRRPRRNHFSDVRC